MKKPEDIKTGEKYKLELLCIHNAGNVIMFETPTGDHLPFRESDLECVSTATPKYDPNRLFRKGDIVEPRKGREVYACEWEDCVFHKLEGTYKVCNDEREGHVSVIAKETGVDCYVSAFALDLVTPVEELEPYEVQEFKETIQVRKRNTSITLATFDKEYHPHAKENAEAERDRLNAEYRKEQK